MPGTPQKRERYAAWAKEIETTEFWERLFLHMANGGSLAEFSKLEDIGYNWLIKNAQSRDEWAAIYARAREARASYHAARIDKMADDVENGLIDPTAARTSADMRKWLAARMDPKQWGDRIQADIKTLDVTQLHLEALRRTISGQAELVIEGE